MIGSRSKGGAFRIRHLRNRGLGPLAPAGRGQSRGLTFQQPARLAADRAGGQDRRSRLPPGALLISDDLVPSRYDRLLRIAELRLLQVVKIKRLWLAVPGLAEPVLFCRLARILDVRT